MKSITLLLVLMFFCFSNCAYAMDNNKEHIAKNLARASIMVAQAENRIAIADMSCPIGIVDDLDYLEFVTGQYFEAIELAHIAHGLSLEIVNNNASSYKVKKDAQSYVKKSLWILQKFTK